jgi:hypothetical protein
MTMHLIIVEGTDARRTQSKRFSGEVQAVANSTRFKMHVAITAVAVAASATLEIADPRRGYAGVTSQVLTKTQASGRDMLVATLGLFQLGPLRPEPVDTGL